MDQTKKTEGIKIEIVPRLEGFRVPDPFAPREQPTASFINALLATAVFRCWHILLFFGGWATMVAVVSHNVYDLSIQPTLLTVVGTVLGFVISYRTTSSFERYNEGRRLWSQIIFASRTFARTVWFHVPDSSSVPNIAPSETQARSVIEKKTVINLVEAFAVSIKHYLRNEDGIYYEDLYYLVKFLPEYALPAGRPSPTDLSSLTQYSTFSSAEVGSGKSEDRSFDHARHQQASSAGVLPFPSTTPPKRRSQLQHKNDKGERPVFRRSGTGDTIIPRKDEAYLLPASLPPKYYLFSIYPFSLLERLFAKESKTAGKVRARLRNKAISHNIPLEISLYLSSYVAALQKRRAIDVPTTNLLISSLGQLVDSLTGLERILTTPIPFSYSIHLWTVTIIFCLLLPFQIWTQLKWLAIPGTVVVAFFFFGFIVAGEEIENPFGYDKNDLNLDHFTHNIIRNELRAITSTPAPDPSIWAFSRDNDLTFASHVDADDCVDRIPPEDWVQRGYAKMQAELAVI